MADDLFTQADLNRDQRLDFNEFRNLIGQNNGFGSPNFASNATGEGQYAGSSHKSSSSPTYGNLGSVSDLIGANINAAGVGGGEAHYSSYVQSSHGSASGTDANGALGFGSGGFQANGSSGVDLTTTAAGISSSSTFEKSSSQQLVQVNPNNPQNLYQDPNPQIIRRAAQGGQLTYTQNVKIRFLQPPPLPPPGPLIIKEVRPPQPPPPPPLRIRQQGAPLPQLPPLVLRERPPDPPASVAPQTVIRRLPALPVPPRSVIIERLPPLPPKPRDIIIERWIPYAAVAKRKTIIQRAEGVKEYPKPRNIIIQYEPIQVRVIRQFQRLGITQENPQLYIQRYGIALLDAQTLVQQARAAGVIEDISPPKSLGSTAASSTSFNAGFNNASSGIQTTGGIGLKTIGDNGASASSFESSNYHGGQQGNASFSGFESGQDGGFSSAYGLNSFSSNGGNAAFSGADFGRASASRNESYSASANGINSNANDPITIAFLAADLNKDGLLDANEFRQFLTAQLRYIQ